MEGEHNQGQEASAGEAEAKGGSRHWGEEVSEGGEQCMTEEHTSSEQVVNQHNSGCDGCEERHGTGRWVVGGKEACRLWGR